jgi:hypothetical protein
VKTSVGYEWVDVIRGAGGDNPGWQWLSEGKGTPLPTANVEAWAAATGVGAPGGAPAPAATSHGGLLGAMIDRDRVMAILSKYAPNNEGIRAAMRELERAFPGVQLLDHPVRLDKLRFPNGAVIDVIVGAGAPGSKWGWMPEN